MPENYNKKPLTFEEQLAQLKVRGLKIQDYKQALNTLSHISYYRLSGYWQLFRKQDEAGCILEDFTLEASFEQAVRRYEFDRKLRLLVLDAIERIEVSLRTRLTYHLAHRYGAFGHIIANNFHPKFRHQDWLDELEHKEASRSQEEFIRHFKNKYEGFPRLPVWMATEVISFGLLSKLFNGLHHEDKYQIAEIYRLHPKTLADWLHVLTYVRNICAHHSRLWNRKLAIRPNLKGLNDVQLKLQPPIRKSDNFFVVLLILNLLLRVNDNGADWRKNIEALVASVKEDCSIYHGMGLPVDWQAHKLWITK